MLKKIKRVLLEKDLTMTALAQNMAVSPSYLYAIISQPREKDIVRIAKALGVNPQLLKS